MRRASDGLIAFIESDGFGSWLGLLDDLKLLRVALQGYRQKFSVVLPVDDAVDEQATAIGNAKLKQLAVFGVAHQDVAGVVRVSAEDGESISSCEGRSPLRRLHLANGHDGSRDQKQQNDFNEEGRPQAEKSRWKQLGLAFVQD